MFFRPPAARVSGVVQESPGTLEYEVALYREASPRWFSVTRFDYTGA